MVKSIPGPLSRQGGLADGAFDSGPGEGEGFGDGCRRDLAGAEEDDWTSWLLYKGGVGVKGDNSWESWWDEEQVNTDFFT